MSKGPGEQGAVFTLVATAWKKGIDDGSIPATKTFYGYTYEQFAALIQPSLDSRAKLAAAELEVTNWENKRNDADAVSVKAAHKVVAAVKGDPDFGASSNLYEDMGYVREGEAQSGLTRKNTAQAKADKAAAKAAKAKAKADAAAAKAAAAKTK